tara:strand:+ start:1582 stop:2721 length:1140 start_codon:yes stop_codon:yes gene_type:complete
MKKKLLFNITEDWFFCSHFLSRALSAKKSGYSIYVCCNRDKHQSIIEEYGINFIYLPYKRKSINPFYEIYVLIRSFFIYRSIKPDIVHQVAAKPIIYGSLAAKLFNIKSVINAPVGLGYVFSSSSIKAKILRPILKFLLKNSLNTHHGKNRKNRVIFENNDDLNYFLEMGALKKKEAFVIRGAGVKIRKFVQKDKPNKLVTITLVARMLIDKGIYEFISAVRILKNKNINTKFLLVGDVDTCNPSSLNRKTLINWNNEGIVEWLGWINNVDKILMETDILCLPSYREGLPKALLEGAACGLPIVTTDTVGCRDVVEDGVNGFLVPIKNVDQLVSKINELINSEILRQNMGKESLKIVSQKFSETIINKQTLDIYKELSN